MAETLTNTNGSLVIKQNSAFARPFYFGTASLTDVNVKLSKTGPSATMAAFANAQNTPATEIGGSGLGNGWYFISLGSTDTNSPGALSYHCSSVTSGGPVDFCDIVQTLVMSDLALTANGQVLVSSNLKQGQPFTALFFMTQVGTTNPAPGLVVTGQRTFGVLGFANVTGSIAEVGGTAAGAGWYVFQGAASDSANPVVGFKFSSPGANDSDFSLWFQP